MSTTEDQARAGYTLGLRKLADILDAHPEIPLPSQGDDDISPIYIGFWLGDAKSRLAEAARVFPCSWDKDVTDRHFNLNGRLGGLHVQLTASRDRVCTRVVTGTEDREVEEVVTPAVTRKVVKPVEVVEWQCGSLLAPQLAGEMDAEITRQRPDSDQQPDPYIDAIAAEHVQEYEPARAEPENQVSPPCARCGSHSVVTCEDGEFRCYNHERCAERVAARDAEAAQVQA